MPNFCFAQIQADGLHRNNHVVSLMSLLEVYYSLYHISKNLGLDRPVMNDTVRGVIFRDTLKIDNPVSLFLSGFSFAHCLRGSLPSLLAVLPCQRSDQ